MRTLLPTLFAACLLSGCVVPGPSGTKPGSDGLELLPSSSDPEVEPAAEILPAPLAVEPRVSPVAETVTPEPVSAPEVETAAKPEPGGAARVVRVNAKLHYVLLETSGRLSAGQEVVAFRQGEAVARLRVSAPRQGHYLSADILDGDVREGDTVR